MILLVDGTNVINRVPELRPAPISGSAILPPKTASPAGKP